MQKSGAWFSFGETRLGQGRENAKQFIRENPDLFAEIRQLVLDAKGVVGKGAPSADPDETPSDGDAGLTRQTPGPRPSRLSGMAVSFSTAAPSLAV